MWVWLDMLPPTSRCVGYWSQKMAMEVLAERLAAVRARIERAVEEIGREVSGDPTYGEQPGDN